MSASVQKSSTVTGVALVLDTLDCGSTSRPAFFRAAILAEMSETWEKRHAQVSQNRLIEFAHVSWRECAACRSPERVRPEIRSTQH